MKTPTFWIYGSIRLWCDFLGVVWFLGVVDHTTPHPGKTGCGCMSIGHSRILIFNPQMEYFHKKVNSQLFKKCCFWRCDVENWVWAKLALWIWGSNRLYTTFPSIFHYYRPIQPIYHTSKKIIFPKKSWFFDRKSALKGPELVQQQNHYSPKSA